MLWSSRSKLMKSDCVSTYQGFGFKKVIRIIFKDYLKTRILTDNCWVNKICLNEQHLVSWAKSLVPPFSPKKIIFICFFSFASKSNDYLSKNALFIASKTHKYSSSSSQIDISAFLFATQQIKILDSSS